MQEKQRAYTILKILRATYQRKPDSFVVAHTPLEYVVGIVLSAQCTDKVVNSVMPKLFAKYEIAVDFANADTQELEAIILRTGFYHTKARYLQGIGRILVEKHGGEVPRTREELLELPGVSYKSANLVMAKVFGIQTGVAVDTHVSRVAPRLGLCPPQSTKNKNTKKIAAALEELYPRKDWLDINEFLILHGRAVCSPRRPKCPDCPVKEFCPSAEKFIKEFWPAA